MGARETGGSTMALLVLLGLGSVMILSVLWQRAVPFQSVAVQFLKESASRCERSCLQSPRGCFSRPPNPSSV